MILVTGGLHAGKRTWVRAALGWTAADLESRAVCDVQRRAAEVGDKPAELEALADELAAREVVVATEVGAGVVPLDAGERESREAAGRLACLLAARADAVVRVVCGLAHVLKGSIPLRVELVRHGATAYTAQGRYQGSLDIALSSEGRAALAPCDLPVGLVHVSPLARSTQTARIVFPTAELVACDDLREMDFGAFEGRTAAEMEGDPAYRAWVDGGCTGACPGGESKVQFCERVCAAFERLVDEAFLRNAPCLTVVAHSGTVMAALERFAVPARGFYDWHVAPGTGWELAVDGAVWRANRTLAVVRATDHTRAGAGPC